jgi:hypothetical protein
MITRVLFGFALVLVLSGCGGNRGATGAADLGDTTTPGTFVGGPPTNSTSNAAGGSLGNGGGSEGTIGTGTGAIGR